MKVAIVTTLIDAENVIKSFVDYHLAIGFDHLYLFFDNPTDPAIEIIRNQKDVTIIPCTDELKKRWIETKTYTTYKHLDAFIGKEPMARQLLNMDIACQMALSDGMNWILHIDIDELFYSPHYNVKDHFNNLSSKNISHKRYLNYEAVPEKEQITDYFKEVTLFKKNPFAYSEEERQNHQQYCTRELFDYYTIGKMAARIDTIYLPGIHEFTFNKEGIGKTLPITKPELHDPAILHFVCCGFESFWKKYKVLADFNPKAFGRQLYSVYEKAQEIITKQNDEISARTYYANSIMIGEETKQHLLTLNLLSRITQPSTLLTSSL